ncbi:hypothetical protein DPMN_131936 [Dreissena polymorpha]|uniref:SGNH hydrolase-type esterase domain-containing protein n=1 Tax=Dreissena polymorpha TaxID=45954 RepID=A0A9D4FVU4_DREPO|nr:hypothetical protein DPMN_131936 [Dreissena polymorpha]
MSGRGKPAGRKRKAQTNLTENEEKRQRDEVPSDHDVPEFIQLLASDKSENTNKRAVWLVGDSHIRWAGERFHSRHRDTFKNFTISWDGQSGLRVEDLHPVIQLGMIKGRTPEIIFLHVGGNNITSTNQCKTIRIIKSELQYLFDIFPNSLIVWVFILPRLSWTREVVDNSYQKKMNSKRQKINRTISNYVLSFARGRAILIESIDLSTPGMFHVDKVHLSDVGNELFIFSIGEAIASFLGSDIKFIKC